MLLSKVLNLVVSTLTTKAVKIKSHNFVGAFNSSKENIKIVIYLLNKNYVWLKNRQMSFWCSWGHKHFYRALKMFYIKKMMMIMYAGIKNKHFKSLTKTLRRVLKKNLASNIVFYISYPKLFWAWINILEYFFATIQYKYKTFLAFTKNAFLFSSN